MLACSFDMSASNAMGLLCAFGSALVFVSSNIFFKKIMPSNTHGHGGITQPSHKLDKINLLLYSSGMAFILMIPVWMYYDLPVFLSGNIAPPKGGGRATPHSVGYYFFMNGTVHWAQNIIAFVILSSTSPVTYSIASLIKRVAVICIAIVWFAQPVHPIQALGIIMTFTGLYMYNNAKGDVAKGEKKIRRMDASRDLVLPSTKEESRILMGMETPPEVAEDAATGSGSGAFARSRAFSMAGQEHGGPGYYSHQRPSPVVGTFGFGKEKGESPLAHSTKDSYPSPPNSVGSPAGESVPLPEVNMGHGHRGQHRLHSVVAG